MRISKIPVALIDIDNNLPITTITDESVKADTTTASSVGKKGHRNAPDQTSRSYDSGNVPARAIGSGKSMRSR